MSVIHLKTSEGKVKCGAKGWYSRSLYASEDKEKVSCKKCLRIRRSSYETVSLSEDYRGKILYCSWGYSMTFVDYVEVIDQTKKTLVVAPIGKEVINDYGQGNGQSTPRPASINCSKKFRIRAKKYKGREDVYFVGSRGGAKYWSLWDGKPNYYNTWD